MFGRIALAIALIAAVSCGGGKGGSNPTPTNPTPTLTAAGVAPSLAAEINTTFKAALRAGVAASAANSTSPREWLARMIDELIGVPLSAQGGFVANCSRGGNIRIQNLVAAPGGGRVQMSSTPVTVTSCGHSLNGRDVFASGTFSATGTWTATEPDSPVRLSGNLNVDGLGSIVLDGTTGASFGGTIGGIAVGTPATTTTVITTSTSTSTTTTTANSTTTTVPGSTTSSTTTSVATTTTTAPTTTTSSPTTSTTTTAPGSTTTTVGGGGVNVTGNWIAPGQNGTLAITQNGSTLTCHTTGLPAGVTETGCGGTINGSNVTITETLTTTQVAAPYSVTCNATNVLTATATSTTMNGNIVGSGSCTISGPAPLPPAPTVPPTTTPVAFVKQ